MLGKRERKKTSSSKVDLLKYDGDGAPLENLKGQDRERSFRRSVNTMFWVSFSLKLWIREKLANSVERGQPPLLLYSRFLVSVWVKIACLGSLPAQFLGTENNTLHIFLIERDLVLEVRSWFLFFFCPPKDFFAYQSVSHNSWLHLLILAVSPFSPAN